MDNNLKKGEKRGKRELKNTTKIKMEKEERRRKKKEALHFFSFYGKHMKENN